MEKNKNISLKKKKNMTNNTFLNGVFIGCEIIYDTSPIILGLLMFSLTNLGGFVFSLLLLTGFFYKNFDFLKKK